MQQQRSTHAAYYTVTVTVKSGKRLFYSNNERAFFIAQLQDLLSMRSFLEHPQAHRSLASHIDLLAYSLLPYSAQLIIFSISKQSVSLLAAVLTERLALYQAEQRSTVAQTSPALLITRLIGPHHALANSVQLHLHHSDWEYDRYSSIGFYLHDRRGDWMRIWRLAHLYSSQASHYYQLLAAQQARLSSQSPAATSAAYVPSTHG